MRIATKSIQRQKRASDGIRICVMRRIKPEFEFDIWIPQLAPSTKLLRDLQNKEITWKNFSKKFELEVLNKKQVYLKLLLYLSKENKITLLCWETQGNCHRALILRKLNVMSG